MVYTLRFVGPTWRIITWFAVNRHPIHVVNADISKSRHRKSGGKSVAETQIFPESQRFSSAIDVRARAYKITEAKKNHVDGESRVPCGRNYCK